MDAFATVAWSRTSVEAVGGRPHQLRRRVETRRGGEPNGHWAEYAAGQHRPSEELVAAVEAEAPGSKAVLDLLVWSTLRVRQPALQVWNSWFSRMSSEDQRRVQGYVTTGKMLIRTRRALERRGTLDSLAVMIALLRRDVETGRVELAEKWVMPICRTLLVLAPELKRFGCANALAEYLESAIFEQIAEVGGQRFTYCGLRFLEIVDLFQRSMLKLEADGVLNADRVSAQFDTLEGVHGADVPLALMPFVFESGLRVNLDLPLAPQVSHPVWVYTKLWALARRRYLPTTSPLNSFPPGDVVKATGGWEVLKELTP